MEVDNDWFGRKAVKNLCRRVRQSLAESTKVQREGGNSIRFVCGSATFSESKKRWILRHRGAAPAFTRRARVSFDSLSYTGTSGHGRSTPVLRNASRRVAAVYPSDPALPQHKTIGRNKAVAAISTKILQSIELRGMFEQVLTSLTMEPPGPPQSLSGISEEKIDFAPFLSQFEDQKNMLRAAMLFCSSIEHSSESWVVEVDAVDESKTRQESAVAPEMESFILYCLSGESLVSKSSDESLPIEGELKDKQVEKTASNKLGLLEARGSQLAGEQSAPNIFSAPLTPLYALTSTSSSCQQPGQPSTAKNENLGQTSFVDGPSDERDTSTQETGGHGHTQPGNGNEIRHRAGTSQSAVPRTETRASKRRKIQNVQREDMGLLEDSEETLSPEQKDGERKTKQLRRSTRTPSLRWVEENIARSQAEFPFISTALEAAPGEIKGDLSKLQVKHQNRCGAELQSRQLNGNDGSQQNTKKALDLDWEEQNKPSLEVLVHSSEWVSLSHLGHFSDYTGFQRRYDSFLPLKFSQSLIDMRNSIEKTLRENHFRENEESDEEVSAEKERLSCVMSKYTEQVKREQKLKQRTTESFGEKEPAMVLRPLLFEQNLQAPVGGCRQDNCSLCYPKIKAGKLHSRPRRGHFRELEFDLLAPELEKGDISGVNTARRSRSKEISAQRKTSLLMLNELRYKLDFISQYNKGLRPKSQDANEKRVREGSVAAPPRGTTPNETKSSGDKSKTPKIVVVADRREEKYNSNVSGHNPVQLPCSAILKEFENLKVRNVVPITSLSRKYTPSAVKECITKALQSLPVSGVADEEVMEEQKAFQRAIRTYGSKADQERIEKREHEEERVLQLRELEYERRGKKLSSEEVELVKFESRPATFVPPAAGNSVCRFGPSCSICEHDPEGNPDARATLIFHPSYRRVDNDYLKLDPDQTIRRSRTKERYLQKEEAREELKLLQQRLDFVEQYNNGFLETKGRRK